MSTCVWCSKALPESRGGRPRQYCSAACRQRAYEMRRFGGRALLERLALTGDTCALCGDRLDFTVKTGPSCPVADHMIPVAYGGPTVPENLHVVHAECNTAKGAAMFWAPRARRKLRRSA